MAALLADIRRLYAYRNLIRVLAAKEIKVRYKSALLGWIWSVLHPLLMMVIFSLICVFIIRIPIEKPPLFLLCALLPWFFVNFSVQASTTSLIEHASLIRSADIPRLAIPLSVVGAHFVNFLITLGLLLVVLAVVLHWPGWLIAWLPLIAGLQFVFVLGISLSCCALHTMYRDVRYVTELAMIVWFYATPVFYPITAVPQAWQPLLAANPLTLFVELYRAVLLARVMPDPGAVILAACYSSAALALGVFIFNRYNPLFADVT